MEGKDDLSAAGGKAPRGALAALEVEQRARGLGRDPELALEPLGVDLGDAEIDPEEVPGAAQLLDLRARLSIQPLDDLARHPTSEARPGPGRD